MNLLQEWHWIWTYKKTNGIPWGHHVCRFGMRHTIRCYVSIELPKTRHHSFFVGSSWKGKSKMLKISKIHLLNVPKDRWTLETGYFEDLTPAIQVQTLPLEGPRSLGVYINSKSSKREVVRSGGVKKKRFENSSKFPQNVQEISS